MICSPETRLVGRCAFLKEGMGTYELIKSSALLYDSFNRWNALYFDVHRLGDKGDADEVDVRNGRSVAMTELAGLRFQGQALFNRFQIQCQPMNHPGLPRGLVEATG